MKNICWKNQKGNIGSTQLLVFPSRANLAIVRIPQLKTGQELLIASSPPRFTNCLGLLYVKVMNVLWLLLCSFFFLLKKLYEKIGRILLLLFITSLIPSLLIWISPRHMDKNNNKKKSFSNILDSYSPPSFCFSWIKKWCVIQKLFIVPQSHMTIFSNKFIFELLLQSRST